MTLSPGGTAVLSGTLRNTLRQAVARGRGRRAAADSAPACSGRPSKGEAVREFRAPLERLPETAEDEVAFRLVLDPGELERGDYELSIDVVKEDQFWLAEKGATPRIIPVVIT